MLLSYPNNNVKLDDKGSQKIIHVCTYIYNIHHFIYILKTYIYINIYLKYMHEHIYIYINNQYVFQMQMLTILL